MAMAAETETRAETPEFKIVRRSLVAVRDCISVDIVNFAGELFQDGLISDAGHQAAIAVTGTAPNTVVARLVSEAMNKLSNSSENFYRFVSIIESRNTNLASILKKDYDPHHTRTVLGTVRRGESSDPIETRRVPLNERMLLYCKHISSPNGLKIYLLPTLVTTYEEEWLPKSHCCSSSASCSSCAQGSFGSWCYWSRKEHIDQCHG